MNDSRYKSVGKNRLPTCSICHKNYDAYYHIPRVIPKCGHTFCQKCITNKVNAKSGRKMFTCPECMNGVIIRRSVADDLPRNVSIIDVISNIKKNSQPQKDQTENDECSEHKKKLDMICFTCKNQKVCSHCAIFGSHKGHQFGKEAPANESDLRDLSDYFQIIQQSIQCTIMPNSPQNIEIKTKLQLRNGLKKIIKLAFKNYYQKIQQKQETLLNQCQQVLLDGSISNNIDKVLNNYEYLKTNYKNQQNNLTQSNVQEIMSKVKNIHLQIQKICEQYDNSVSQYLNVAMRNINQHNFFKIQDISSSSLKDIITGTPQYSRFSSNKKQNLSRTPPKRNSRKPTFSGQQSVYYTQNLSPEKNQDRSQANIQSSKEVKQNPQFHNGALEQYRLSDSPAQSLKPIIQSPNVLLSGVNDVSKLDIRNNNSKQLNKTKKQEKTSRSKASIKKSSINKPQKSIQQNDYVNDDELKYARPLKQINYQLRTKLQNLYPKIDRHLEQNSSALQLIGLELNDTLVWYLCDYLISKKAKFSMMKFVKNSITDEGFRILLAYLLNDKTMKVLNMTGNQLSNKSIEYIVKFIEKNNILKTFYLSNNKVSPMQLKKKKQIFEANFLEVII